VKSKDPKRGAYCAGGTAQAVRDCVPNHFLWRAKACAGEAAQAGATCGRVKKRQEARRQGYKPCAGEAAQAVATCGRVELENTMATLMLEGGADIRYIQAMLGHKRLDTTQIYTHVSIRMLQQVHAATHPAARLSP